jgi:hypothetical protein
MKPELLMLLVIVLAFVYSLNNSRYEIETPAPPAPPAPPTPPAPPAVSNYTSNQVCIANNAGACDMCTISHQDIPPNLNTVTYDSNRGNPFTDPSGRIYLLTRVGNSASIVQVVHIIDDHQTGQITEEIPLNRPGAGSARGISYDYNTKTMYGLAVSGEMSDSPGLGGMFKWKLDTNEYSRITPQFPTNNYEVWSIPVVNPLSGNLFFLARINTDNSITGLQNKIGKIDTSGVLTFLPISQTHYWHSLNDLVNEPYPFNSVQVDGGDNYYYFLNTGKTTSYTSCVYKNNTLLFCAPNIKSFLVDMYGTVFYISDKKICMYKNGNSVDLFEEQGDKKYYSFCIDPHGNFVYFRRVLIIATDNSEYGPIERLDIICPKTTCIGGEVSTIADGVSVLSLDASGNDISILDSQGVVTYNEVGMITQQSNIGPTNTVAQWNYNYNPTIVCYDTNGFKYVVDVRGTNTHIWMIYPNGSWSAILSDSSYIISDMCHDFNNNIYILTTDNTILVFNTVYEPIQGIYTMDRFDTFHSVPGSPEVGSITVSPDGTVFGSNGTGIYSIEPFYDMTGNIVNTSYTPVLVAGSATNNGYTDGQNALFNNITSITSDIEGTIYVCDYDNYAIRALVPDPLTGILDTVTIAGNGVSGLVDGTGPVARFVHPSAVRWTTNSTGECILYVLDDGTYIRRIK